MLEKSILTDGNEAGILEEMKYIALPAEWQGALFG